MTFVLFILTTRNSTPILKRNYRGQEAAPKMPLTVKATLLHPVLVLPQDERDPDTNALFLQGLVIAQYVRCPRSEKNSSMHASGETEAVTAEARDTSLEVRLETTGV